PHTSRAACSRASASSQTRWSRLYPTIFGASAKPASSTAAWPRAHRDSVESQYAPKAARARSTSVFERERHAGAEGRDLPVIHLHVHLGDLGDAQITQRAGGGLHRDAAGILPRFLADPHHVDNAIDGVRLFLRHDRSFRG